MEVWRRDKMPICPQCGNELTYLDGYDRWYCNICNTYWPSTLMGIDSSNRFAEPNNPQVEEYPQTATPYYSQPIPEQNPTPTAPSQDFGNSQYSPYAPSFGYVPKKKRRGGKGFTILTIFLVIALIATGLWGLSVKNAYNNLSDEHSELEGQYNSLTDSYNGLQTEYNNLESNYNTLSNDYDSLHDSYGNLENDYNILNSEYNNLNDDYNELNSEYAVEKTMHIGHLLSDYYDVVREKHAPSGWWIFNPSPQEYVDFAGDLARHGLGRIYWADIENDFYQNSYDSYGKYIHSYTEAKNDLNAVYNLIGISSSDTSTIRIKKILGFVNENIHYEHDMYGSFSAPMETIGSKSGDCEDYSILVGALFEMAGIQTAIALSDNHGFLLVKLNNLGGYGYSSYNDLTSIGLSSGKWIIIEPQRTIEGQSSFDPNSQEYSIKAAEEI